MIDDDNLMITTIMYLFGFDQVKASTYLNQARWLFATYPKVGHDFAPWTFNAFAYRFDNDYGGNGIAMGDGVYKRMEADGLAGEGADFIFFHEFAHHIQYQTGVMLYPPYTTFSTMPERTRYKELMADALAAYYAIHARGGTSRKERIEEIARAAFNVGDCAFENAGHHGTPNQRAAAVQFAHDMIFSHPNQGQPLRADTFINAFMASYETMIAPDAVTADAVTAEDSMAPNSNLTSSSVMGASAGMAVNVTKSASP